MANMLLKCSYNKAFGVKNAGFINRISHFSTNTHHSGLEALTAVGRGIYLPSIHACINPLK